MGNAAGKLNSSTVCDGGGLVPNGIYKEDAQDFDAKAVQRLIFARHMAPFYLGADDPEEDSKAGPTAQPPGSNDNNNNDDGWWSYNLMLAQRESSEPLGNTGSALNGGQLSSASSTDDGLLHQSQGDRTAASGHTRKGSGLLRRLKGSSPPNQQTSDAQQPARSQSTPLAQHERSLSDAAARAPEDVWRQLLRRHIECPICFLYYPKNINYTRCCHKPICTECFVQIKRKIEDDRIESTHCPYCVEPNLGIVYYSPAINNTGRAYTKHRKQLSSQLSQSSIASSTKGTQPTISADSSSSPASSQQHIRSATTVSQTPPAVLAEAGRARSHSSASTIGGGGGGGGPGRLVEPTIVMSDDIRPSLAKELAGQLDSKRKQQLRSAENMAMIAAATRRMSSRQQQRLSQARMSGDTSAIDDMPLAYIQSSAMRARLLDRGSRTSSMSSSSSSRPTTNRSAGNAGAASSATQHQQYESDYSMLYAEMRAAGHTDLEEFLFQRAIRMSLRESESESANQGGSSSSSSGGGAGNAQAPLATTPLASDDPVVEAATAEGARSTEGRPSSEEQQQSREPSASSTVAADAAADSDADSADSDDEHPSPPPPPLPHRSSTDRDTNRPSQPNTPPPQHEDSSADNSANRQPALRPPPAPPPRHSFHSAADVQPGDDPIVFDSNELDAIANVISSSRRSRAKPPPPPPPPRLNTIRQLTTVTRYNSTSHGRSVSGGVIDTSTRSLANDLLDFGDDEPPQAPPPSLPLRRRPSLPHPDDGGATQLSVTNPFHHAQLTASFSSNPEAAVSSPSIGSNDTPTRRRRQPPPPPLPARDSQTKDRERSASDSPPSNQQPVISLL